MRDHRKVDGGDKTKQDKKDWSRITSKMEDAYELVRSKVYLCYTCDDRPYKIKQSKGMLVL